MQGVLAEAPGHGAAAARQRAWVALAAIVAVACAARWGGLVGPFGEGWQHLGAFYGKQARNYLRYGPLETGFAGVVNAEETAASERVWYLHHPPGLAWTMAACFAALGTSAFAAKISGVIAALAQVVITFLLVARCLSRRAGLAAAFTTAVVPAGAYFSTHGSELGPQAMALLLLAFLLDARARERDPAHPPVAGTAAALAGAALYSWVALPAAAAIALPDLRARRWRRLAAVAAVAALPFALHIAQAWWVARQGGDNVRGGELLSALANRSVGPSDWWARFDLTTAVDRIGGHLRFDFTRIGLALALAGALLFLARRASARLRPLGLERARPLLLALLVVALGYTVPFAQSVLLHRYWLLVALPLAALLVGVTTHVLAARRAGAWIAAALLAAMAWEGLDATLRRQADDATPWYEEAGRVARERVPARHPLITCEPLSACLEFYAERRVIGNAGDADLPADASALVAELGPRVPWFVLALPPVVEPNVAWRQVPDYLETHFFEAVRRQLPGCARELRLYDLARRPDGSVYEWP